MSGHSKWAKIKRAKGATDAKRGALFTKLARDITMATQEGGGDIDMNFTLRLAVDKAKEANMPKDNIERAIKKGTGELKEGAPMQRIVYEAIGPGGVGMLIQCTTDNTNRTVSEVKNLAEKLGAKFAAVGSVSWQFKEQGQIELGAAKLKESEKFGKDDEYVNANLEDLEMLILDLPGVLDYEVIDPADDPDFEADDSRPQDRKYVVLRTEKHDLNEVLTKFKQEGWQVLESEIIQHPENKTAISEADSDKLASLISELLEEDDVDDVFTNVQD